MTKCLSASLQTLRGDEPGGHLACTTRIEPPMVRNLLLPVPCFSFTQINRFHLINVLISCLFPEDSGNSSEDSESEDPPDKKSSPWQGMTEAPQGQEVKDEEEKPAEDANVVNTTTPASSNAVTMTTMAALGHTQASATPPRPSIPQEQADRVLTQLEKGEEPSVDVSVSPLHLDNKMSPSQASPLQSKMSSVPEKLTKTPPTPDRANKSSLLLEKRNKMSPSAADKHKMSAVPDKQPQPSCPLLEPTEEDDSRSTPLSSPKVKGRRTNLKEMDCETPPRILCPASTTPSPAPCHSASPSHTVAVAMSSPPRGVLKRQDEPMVILHCLPAQRLHTELPTPTPLDSDTDSATEEEEGEEERSGRAVKRKTVEHGTAEKKPRPDWKQEEATPTSPNKTMALPKMSAGTSPKNLPSPVRRVDTVRTTDVAVKLEEEKMKEGAEESLVGGAVKEADPKVAAPPVVPEALGPIGLEELMPQIGPEALVCHEVDLDEPDEKERHASSSAEPHLLILKEQQTNHLPALPHLLHTSLPSPHTPLLPQTQARPLLPASPTPSLENIHLARSAAVPERGLAMSTETQEGDADSSPGFDASTSSSTSSSSLQDTKDRGMTDICSSQLDVSTTSFHLIGCRLICLS